MLRPRAPETGSNAKESIDPWLTVKAMSPLPSLAKIPRSRSKVASVPDNGSESNSSVAAPSALGFAHP
jgi:hypothetical protein